MLLEYAEGARLYVPLTRPDLIQKYRSSEGVKKLRAQPSRHRKPGPKPSPAFRKAMKDMTDELLKLYAERKMAKGHAFPAGQ